MSDTITGILKCVGRQQCVVRTGDRSYRKGQLEIMVLPEFARQYALSEGASVTGQVEQKNGKTRMVSIETLGGMKGGGVNAARQGAAAGRHC